MKETRSNIMSLESVRSFIDRMKSDDEFRDKVISCKDNESRKAFVESESLSFTLEELKEANVELSEEDLADMAGGGYSTCTKHPGFDI